MTTAQLKLYTVDQMERLYRDGRCSEQDMREFCRLWNTYTHRLTNATFRDGGIDLEACR